MEYAGQTPKNIFPIIFKLLLILLVAWLFGNSLGYDSSDILGASLSRGQIGMVVLLPALLALPATVSLIRENSGKRKIPFFAHFHTSGVSSSSDWPRNEHHNHR